MKNNTPPPPPPKMNEELTGMVNAMRALTVTHTLLTKGAFVGSDFQAVVDCQAFIRSLHQEITSRGISLHQEMTSRGIIHPDANQFDELKKIKEAQANPEKIESPQ